MWTLLAIAAAGDLGRETEALKATRYAKLDGEGPVTGRWRNRSGAFLAWHFADGQVEHVETYEGATLVSTRTFDASGRPEATVDWGVPAVTVHLAPPAVVPIGAWVPLGLGPLTVQVPPDLQPAGDGIWASPTARIERQPAADPFAPAFRDEVARTCGCEVGARRTVWLAGHPGVQLRLDRPGRTADLVAVALDDGLWVLASAGDDPGDLAPLRAMMATAREAPR